jgi:hypothetical protein
MDDPSLETNSSALTDQYPLLMERVGSHNDHEHIIDISRNGDASSSSSHDDQPPRMDSTQHEDRPSSGTRPPTYQTSLSSSNRLNSRTSSFRRRGDGYGRRRRSPLNSGLWISVELVVTVSQIIASVVVLSLSRNENPQTPLFEWVVGYASGCVATLPILYWRYRNRNQSTEQDSPQSHQGSSQSNTPEPTSYTAISATQSLDEENVQTSENFSRNNQLGTLSARYHCLHFVHLVFKSLVMHFVFQIDAHVPIYQVLFSLHYEIIMSTLIKNDNVNT